MVSLEFSCHCFQQRCTTFPEEISGLIVNGVNHSKTELRHCSFEI